MSTPLGLALFFASAAFYADAVKVDALGETVDAGVFTWRFALRI